MVLRPSLSLILSTSAQIFDNFDHFFSGHIWEAFPCLKGVMLGVVGKACDIYFPMVPSLCESEFCEVNYGLGVFNLFFSAFLTNILAKPEMPPANLDTLVVDAFTLFLKGS